MKCEPALAPGTLVKRYKRFMADVQLPDGSVLTVHCPNTGSMKHCNLPGSRVLYSDSGNDKRKYRHTLEAVSTPSGCWAGVNTSRPMALVLEGIHSGLVQELQGYSEIRQEVPYGDENSRIDLLLQSAGRPPCYVEIKNVTMERSREVVAFPDAVTERGSKHLRELISVARAGARGVLLFCVQHDTASVVKPADDIDAVYGRTLREAQQAGVEVLAYGARISPQAICLDRKLRVEC